MECSYFQDEIDRLTCCVEPKRSFEAGTFCFALFCFFDWGKLGTVAEDNIFTFFAICIQWSHYLGKLFVAILRNIISADYDSG